MRDKGKEKGKKKELEEVGKENEGAKKKWRSLKAGGEKTWDEGREEKQGVAMAMKIQQGQLKSEEEETCKRRRKTNKIIKGKKSENRRRKKLVEEQVEKRTKKRRG